MAAKNITRSLMLPVHVVLSLRIIISVRIEQRPGRTFMDFCVRADIGFEQHFYNDLHLKIRPSLNYE